MPDLLEALLRRAGILPALAPPPIHSRSVSSDASVSPTPSAPEEDEGTVDNDDRLRRVESLPLLSKTNPKDFWMRDDKAKECYDCKTPFSTFRRRHHCRICGQIFCHRCASNILPGEQFGYGSEELRVCDFCLRVMDDYKYTMNVF
jgi:hypothetical protein